MKVTIVIPVYNVAPYLRACLSSIAEAIEACKSESVKCNVDEVEIICVDDGSSDGSYRILKELFAGLRFTLKLLHFPVNRGVSAARNAALDAATGEVIAFVDPDDTVERTWLKTLLDALGESEMVWSGYRQNGALVEPSDVGAIYEGDAVRWRLWRAVFGYRLRDLVNLILPGGLWRHTRREMAGIWRCAVRRTALGDLRFDETLRLYEDAIFLASLAARVKSLKIVGNCGYEWRVRETGAMMRGFRDNLLANKFAVRDARRAIDPKMTHWRGTFLLSFFEVWKLAGFRAALKYLR